MAEKSSGSSIYSWLCDVGLEQYDELFVSEVILLEDLPFLTESDIDRLGLPTGPRRKLLIAIDQMREQLARECKIQSGGSTHPDRRQLTVMFCDLVGSTALAERMDPEESKAVMQQYRAAVAKVVEDYGGHVKQYQGDAVKVYFGWPSAHEDAAERCIRAGLEIVAAVSAIPLTPPLKVKIGVATGKVAVDAEDAVGATPNRAARLQQEIASPNEMVITDSTRRLIGDGFDLDDIGCHSLKGVREPLQAWRVCRVGKAESRFDASRDGPLTPLVGREDIIQCLKQLAAQRIGKVVLLSGESGIGKSRVLRELRGSLEVDGIVPLRFQCLPYRADRAFWPIIHYLERRLELSQDDSNTARFDKLRALLSSQPGQSEHSLSSIASLLSIDCEDPIDVPALTPQKQKEVTIDSLLNLLTSMAVASPSVVLIEDLHWVDATTLEVLAQFIDRVKDLPILVVLTYRPEFVLQEEVRKLPGFGLWETGKHVTSYAISRLSTEESETVVRRVSGDRELSASMVHQLVSRSDGVPLYIEEMTKLVLERLADLDGGQSPFGNEESIDIPATLRDSLRARLDRDVKLMEIAQIGAAIGREFDKDLISIVAGVVLNASQADIDDMLQRLTESALAYRKDNQSQPTYAFKHALVREEAYESIPRKDRLPRLHREIATAMEQLIPDITSSEPELLASHYSRAGNPLRASELWLSAGQKALAKWTLLEAIAHFNRSLEEITRLPPEIRDARELDCRLLLSLAHEAYGGWPSQELANVLKPALPLARRIGEPMALARTLWGLWVQLMSVGPVQESLQWAEECLNTGLERRDEALEIVGRMAVMVCNFWLGNHIVVRKHAEAILALYDHERHKHIVFSMNHDPKTLAGIYLSQVLWILGYPDQGAALVEERDNHARSVGHPFDTGFVLTLGAWVYHYRREPAEQIDRHEEIMTLADEAGLPFISLVLAPFLSSGLSHLQQGNLPQGIRDMRTGIGFWQGAGANAVIPYVKSRLGEALAASGDLDAGLEHVNEALAQIEKPGWQERSHLVEILRIKGDMLVQNGDSAGAEICYLESLQWARQQAAKSFELRTAISLAGLWKTQQREREARDLLKPIYEWFSEGFTTKDLIEAQTLLTSLST